MNQPARRRSSYKPIPEEQLQHSTTDTTTAAASSSAKKNKNTNTNTNTNRTTRSITTNTNTNTNAMDGAHRKIELQSPEDLTFLINNVRRAATEHVTAAFPPVEGQDDAEEDELRVRIEKLVDDVRAVPSSYPLPSPLFRNLHPHTTHTQHTHTHIHTYTTRAGQDRDSIAQNSTICSCKQSKTKTIKKD